MTARVLPPLFVVVLENLNKLINDFKARTELGNGEKPEIEVRLGRSTGGFSSEVDPNVWHKKHALFCNDPSYLHTNSYTTDTVYPVNTMMTVRKEEVVSLDDSLMGAKRSVRPDEHRPPARLDSKLKYKKYDEKTVEKHSLKHDLRFSLNFEKALGEREFAQLVDSKPSSGGRTKYRFNFVRDADLFPRSWWAIDMTQVITQSSSSSSSSSSSAAPPTRKETYEIELEMVASGDELRAMDDAQIEEAAMELFKLILAFSSSKEQRVKHQTVPVEERLKVEINRKMMSCMDKSPRSSISFAGLMPSNLKHSSIEDMKSRDRPYMVTDKADGQRFLMLISSRFGGVFLVNRKCDTFKVFGFTDDFVERIAPRADPLVPGSFDKDAIIDGEIIPHFLTGVFSFLIFDMLMWKGDNVAPRPFNERLAWFNPLVTAFRESHTELQSHFVPFVIISKIFRPVNTLDKFNKVFTSNVERRFLRDSMSLQPSTNRLHNYVFCDPQSMDRSVPRRCHKVDGLIFVPPDPYRSGSSNTYFKWKYSNLHTIDFRIVLKEGINNPADLQYVDLYTEANSISPSGMPVSGKVAVKCKSVELTRTDQAKLFEHYCQHIKPFLVQTTDDQFSSYIQYNNSLAINSSAPKATVQRVRPIIAEMSFEPRRNQWHIKKFRHDKDTPNFIHVVMDTLEQIASPVSLNELLRQLSSF